MEAQKTQVVLGQLEQPPIQGTAVLTLAATNKAAAAVVTREMLNLTTPAQTWLGEWKEAPLQEAEVTTPAFLTNQEQSITIIPANQGLGLPAKKMKTVEVGLFYFH